MFRRVLVANRGEIAVRIFRTVRRLGLESVAVYSDADVDAMHARAADQRVRLGPGDAAASYLHMGRVLDAARSTGADAIHPGYGFLSENPEFAQRCQDAGLAWVGPPPEAMRKLGHKIPARELAARHGVPTAPGSDGALRDVAEARRAAQDVGYPVLLKASAGGGGIGMRVVSQASEMEREFRAAQATARAAFGDDALFLEKYLERPRHIELQVMADAKGRAVHFGERECSIQRRHQKLVEEAPSPALTNAERTRLGEWGLKLLKAAGYANAGTLEFLYQDGQFYFNEVNARLQVEHPVTEAVYGVDLVEGQLRVAVGEPLPWRSTDLRRNGHAIEVRLNAEDPLRDFAPTPGRIESWVLASGEGIRIDTGFHPGARVPPQYDSLLAKLIAWGPTREAALERLATSLSASRVEGLTTNLGLHRVVMADEAFRQGELSTRFLAERKILARLEEAHARTRGRAFLVAAALAAGGRGGVGAAYARARRPSVLGEASE